MYWTKVFRVGKPIIFLFVGFMLSGCFSRIEPVLIDETQVSMASFSCVSLNQCWAFTDGDANSPNSGLRRGFLELGSNEWKRKKAWGNFWFDKTDGGKPIGAKSSLSINNKDSGWLSYNGRLYKRNPYSVNEWNSKGGSSSAEWILFPNPFHKNFEEEGTVQQVFFVNSIQGWITSTTGKIAHTNDEGTHWAIYDIHTGKNFSSIFFLDSSQGWAVSTHKELFRTLNGGKDWNKVGSLVESNIITQLNFIDTESGWISIEGAASPVFTKDGGKTWDNPIPNGDELRSVYYFDSLHGWAIKPGVGILHSSDGGKTWTQQKISDYWHEHPINLIWKVPARMVGSLLIRFGSLPEPLRSFAGSMGK